MEIDLVKNFYDSSQVPNLLSNFGISLKIHGS